MTRVAMHTSERNTRLVLAIALASVVASACGGGGGGGSAAKPEQPEDWECRERRAAYIATNAFAGPEVGVVIDCAERGPRIKRWVVINEGGDRQTSEHSLTVEEFEALWEKVEATGWRNLEDCSNPDAEEGDPAYKFGIANDQAATTAACAGKVLPFPFNRLLNELDLIAAKYS